MNRSCAMKALAIVFVSALVGGNAGCVSVPQAAIDVNKQVSNGISTIGGNGIAMVDAWEESAYNMLDERWAKIYAKADSTYRTRKGVAQGAQLTYQQQEDIAGLAVLIRSDVRKKIKDEADSMRGIIASNVKNTVEANDSITGLLASASAVSSLQKSALKEVGSLIPIPPVIGSFITNSLAKADL
ncbi:hypothetical protein BTA51_13480 [Hahella sp. CCB-MM4]|uniref:hypothetical protein n=1 Tax=Hahella sp. (strain CCB-MM4) TaxID=1926491 RepID=UPI000B9C083B|nr:hypothetical protein [Hahella sp. CCB-MM4]OZG72965.1 hypothetical protein BTA51_13480 [Hahella sp. CCB-MM4]